MRNPPPLALRSLPAFPCLRWSREEWRRAREKHVPALPADKKNNDAYRWCAWRSARWRKILILMEKVSLAPSAAERETNDTPRATPWLLCCLVNFYGEETPADLCGMTYNAHYGYGITGFSVVHTRSRGQVSSVFSRGLRWICYLYSGLQFPRWFDDLSALPRRSNYLLSFIIEIIRTSLRVSGIERACIWIFVSDNICLNTDFGLTLVSFLCISYASMVQVELLLQMTYNFLLCTLILVLRRCLSLSFK